MLKLAIDTEAIETEAIETALWWSMLSCGLIEATPACGLFSFGYVGYIVFRRLSSRHVQSQSHEDREDRGA